ncbi:MAG: lysylphosphatidylglycerol synthase domain-containing protein [Niabella sp.]
MKVSKNIKIFFNYFLGPALFIWLAWSIYHQVSKQPDLAASWQYIKGSLNGSRIWLLIGTVLLMLISWGIETAKWRMAILKLQYISFGNAYKAVLAGASVAIATPARIGEYVGRVFYIEEGNRIKAASITVATSFSQLIVTILMGTVGLWLLRPFIIQQDILSPAWANAILWASFGTLIILLLIYFRISWLAKWLDKLPFFKKISWIIQDLEGFDAIFLAKILSLSILRYFVFILQYFLLFQLFGVKTDIWQTFMSTSVVMLVISVIPAIALFTDLGIRNEVSLKMVGLFSANHLGISFAAIGIWFINIIIPAIIGSLLILGMKRIFKKNI